MAIANYSNLQTAITNWMNRGTVLDSYRDDFIALAESRIARELKTNELHTTTTLSVDAQTETLPTDYSGMVRADFGDDYPTITYIPPDLFHSTYATTQTGVPIFYTIEANTIYFAPTPDTTYTLNYTYIAKPDIATDTTNRLLTIYPDLYLFACLVEAADFDDDEIKAAKFESKYLKALNSAHESDQFKGPLSFVSDVP